MSWRRVEVIITTPVTGRTGPALSLFFNNFTQLGLWLHSCTSLTLSLSHASLLGFSVRAHVLHCVDERMLHPRSNASCHDQSAHGAFLWDCNSHVGLGSAAPDAENLAAFYDP